MQEFTEGHLKVIKAKREGKYLLGIHTEGLKTPFFALSHYLKYEKLGNLLNSQQPFYCFEPSFYSSRKEIAAHYIKEMKNIQPNGPYFLGAYCKFGRIALEMAEQLAACGEKINVLVLIEFYGPKAEKQLLRYTQISKWCSVHFPLLYNVSRKKQIRSVFKKIVEIYSYFFKKTLKESALVKNFNGRIPAIQIQIERVILIEARDHYLSYPLMGWSNYFNGKVNLIKVAGRHEDLFKEPYVRYVAEALNAILK